MDLIDRQAAIDALGWGNEWDVMGFTVIDKDDAIRQIKALPSAQPEPKRGRWIPVSERLPDRDGRYLVTCSRIGACVVDWNIWHCEPKPSWLWEQGVTAWQPLPEPYEEGAT